MPAILLSDSRPALVRRASTGLGSATVDIVLLVAVEKSVIAEGLRKQVGLKS